MLFFSAGGNQEQAAARERSHEASQGDMQRRFHISDEASADGTAGITDQVRFYLSVMCSYKNQSAH